MSEWEGFDFEEEEEIEEISYSFMDYLLAPIKFTVRTFKAVRQKPKLLYWILLLLIATAVALIPSYIQASKIEIQVVGEGVNEEMIKMIEATQEMFMKNPAFLGITIFVSSLIIQLVGAVVYFLVSKVFGGRGSFSSHLMVIGMTSVPTIFMSLLEIPFFMTSPPVQITIDITTGRSQGGFTVDPMVQVLSMVIALWSAAIVYYGAKYTSKLDSDKKALLVAVIIYVVMELPMLMSMVVG